MKRALFICSANKLKSPTAAKIFATWADIETDSAGLASDAAKVLSVDQLNWASIIFVMEKSHLNRLRRRSKAELKGKRLVCLDIPDEYEFMDPVLIKLLEAKVARYLV